VVQRRRWRQVTGSQPESDLKSVETVGLCFWNSGGEKSSGPPKGPKVAVQKPRAGRRLNCVACLVRRQASPAKSPIFMGKIASEGPMCQAGVTRGVTVQRLDAMSLNPTPEKALAVKSDG
jgi:hypothetical protein